jgi:TolB-like protein/DNA-binding winged helix-turn-helix (wHTH) protein/Flp pilus assembly protein TadD
MDLLILLVERRSQLVSRGEIVDRLWGPDVFVDVETGVHTAVRKIRQALRDSSDTPTFVETVQGKGYRFIATVEVLPAPANQLAPPTADPQAALTDPAHGPAQAAATHANSESAPQPFPGTRVTQSRRAWFVLGLLAVLALIAGVVWGWRWTTPGTSRVTLAVLPFENLSRDPDRDYVADGLAEETIVSLGQVDPEHLLVLGRTSSMRYRGTSMSPAEIGRELRADYLVEGSISAEGALLRTTAKLIRVRDQVQVWSDSYDREPASILGLQQELSSAIARQIGHRLSPERVDTLARRQTRSAEAYDMYLRGLNFFNQRTPATTKQAIDYFTRATAIDPGYALAWHGLAQAIGSSPINGDAPPALVAPRARDAAAKAVAADPNLAEAQFSRGYVRWLLDWDWPGAEADFRRAVALDPSFAPAHMSLGHALSQMGRHSEAALSMARARELEPLSPIRYALSSQVAFQARDYPAALAHADRAIALDQQFWIGQMVRGQVYTEMGKYDLALKDLTMAERFSGTNSKAISLRGYILAKLGRTADANAVLSALEAASGTKYVPPFAMALINVGLGQKDRAFDWLERAYQARDVHLMYLTVDPKWDPLRKDPRFEKLLTRCGWTPTKPR